MRDATYIGNIQKIVGNSSNVQRILKMVEFNTFAAHYEQHFKSITWHTDLPKFMTFKRVQHIKPIREMKSFM